MRSCACPTCTLNCPRQVFHFSLARGAHGKGVADGTCRQKSASANRLKLLDHLLGCTLSVGFWLKFIWCYDTRDRRASNKKAVLPIRSYGCAPIAGSAFIRN